MNDKAMHLYLGKPDPLKIVRGGVFGGRKQVRERVLVVRTVGSACVHVAEVCIVCVSKC